VGFPVHFCAGWPVFPSGQPFRTPPDRRTPANLGVWVETCGFMPKMRLFRFLNFVSPIKQTLSNKGIVPAAVFAFIVPEGTAVVLFFTITFSFAVLCAGAGFFVVMDMRHSRYKLTTPIVCENLRPFAKADNRVAIGLLQYSSVLRRKAMTESAVTLTKGIQRWVRVVPSPTVVSGREVSAVIT